MKRLIRLFPLAFVLALSLMLASGAAAETLSGQNMGVLPLNGVPHPVNNTAVLDSFVTFHLDAPVRFTLECSVPYDSAPIDLQLYKGTPEDCTRLVTSGTAGYETISGRRVTKLMPLYLTKGDYAVMLQRYGSLSSSSLLTASVSPLPSDDAGDNDTAGNAAPIAFPGSADGIINSFGDVDFYKFTLAQAGPVELSVRNKLGENTMRLDVSSGGETVYSAAMDASSVNQLFTRRLYLDAGEHTVSLQLNGQYKYRGFAYNLSVRPGDPIETVWMPTSATLTEGISGQLYIAMSDTYLNCAQFTWTSDKTAVATVDNSGVVTGASPGIATITATSPDGKMSLQCKTTVRENVLTRSKPYVGKKKGLYSSAKKIYYQGNMLYVEVYVYNKLGFTTPPLYNWVALVYYLKGWNDYYDEPVFGCASYRYLEIPSIRNNSYKVVKFSRDKTGQTRMDLRSGQFDALVCDEDTFNNEFGGYVSWKGLSPNRITKKPLGWKLYHAPIKEGK